MRAEDSQGVFGSAAPGTAGTGPRRKRDTTAASGVEELLIAGEDEQNTIPLQTPAEDATLGSEKKTKKGATSKSKAKAKDKPQEVDAEEDEYSYVGSDNEVVTRDIERIWISEDEAEDRMVLDNEGEEDQGPIGHSRATPKMKSRSSTSGAAALRPLRAPREPRTEGSESSTTVAKTQDEDEMEIDEGFATEPPNSLDQTRKGAREAGGGSSKRKSFRPSKAESIEEREERLRLAADATRLRTIFAPEMGASADAKNVNEEEAGGGMFIFQLPPLTPYVVPEGTQYEIDEHLEDPDSKPAASQPSKIKKEPPTEVKIEDDTIQDNKPLKIPGALTAKSPLLPGGVVGKLNIHRSGRVTLKWGGTAGVDMQVNLGAEVDFLQDVVLIDAGDAGDVDVEGDKGDEGQRRGWSLGQASHKVVVVPDWGRLYD